MRIDHAQALTPSALTTLFNDGYRGYLVPLTLDEPALRRHLVHNDIDLTASRVAVIGDRPVSFALVGRRGAEAWLGGVGTVPSHRRRGVGELTLTSALDALARTGAATVSLEVLEGNAAAIVLYEKLGFRVTRRLTIWRLSSAVLPHPLASLDPETRSLSVDAAHAWIADHRPSDEPWQRADVSLGRLCEEARHVDACGVNRSGNIVAAAICAHDGTGTRVLQLSALDQNAAAQAVAAVAASSAGRPVGLVNFPEDEPLAAALAAAGLLPAHVQLEMHMSLTAPHGHQRADLRPGPPDP